MFKLWSKFHLAALGAVGVALTTLSSTPAQAFTIYTDRAAWESAVGSFTTETFDKDIPNADVITFGNGVVSKGVGGIELNEVFFGLYVGDLDTSDDFPPLFNEIRWTLPSPVVAFGADWFSTATGSGLTISGDFDGTGLQTLSFASVLGEPGTGFLGILGTAPFTEIIFREERPIDRGIGDEVFLVDNFSLAAAPPVESVPEPTVLAGLAVVGAGLLWRRRST